MMKLNEDIIDANEKTLLELSNHINTKINNIINQLLITFKCDDSVKIKELLAKLKFFKSAEEKLRERLQKHDLN